MLRYEQKCVIKHWIRKYINKSLRKETLNKGLNGFKWIYVPIDQGEWHLVSPKGKNAATIYCKYREVSEFIWFVWDEFGSGGENDVTYTLEKAMNEAENATILWGIFV